MISNPAAVHESSHLICGLLNAAKITKVICNGANHDGTCYSKHPGFWNDKISIRHPLTRQALMILLSGPAGEFKMIGYKNMGCAEVDVRLARACIRLKGFDDEGLDDLAFYEKFSGDAEKFISHPVRWKMIQALSKELHERRHMSGQEAVRFVRQEADKLPVLDKLELFFPHDQLGGYMLPLSEHGN